MGELKMKSLEEKNVLEIICDDEEQVLKQKLKDLLAIICYGKEEVEIETVTFEETIEELNKRIERKTENQKAGMIGELLFHLKSYEYLEEYSHISVYLNREERSVKKGFDVLLFDGERVWYSEVKSKENGDNEDITYLHVAKIKEAINDIKEKFKGENKNYWISAKTNIANIGEKDLKKQIADILTKDINPEIEKDAIGVSAVFKRNAENIEEGKVKEVLDGEKENFNHLAAVCLTHEDYNKIIKILKELGNGSKF